MTTKEFKRLKIFLKSYGDNEILSHSFLITQKEEFIGNPFDKKQKKLLSKDTFIGVRYKQIKRLSLWISTSYGTFYF